VEIALREVPARVDHALALVAEMQADENRLLSERVSRAARGSQMALWIDAALVAIALAVGFWILAGFRREMEARRQAVEVARESESELRQLIDALPAACAYVDGERCVRHHNRMFRNLLGLSPEEISGKPAREVLGRAYFDRYVAPHANRALEGDTVRYERRQRGVDGVERILDCLYVPHATLDGQLLGFYGFLIDITDRKRAEEALRRSEERFRLAVEASPDGVLLVDAQGKITLVNAL
jgi:PAS domain S-box-containing protein